MNVQIFQIYVENLSMIQRQVYFLQKPKQFLKEFHHW